MAKTATKQAPTPLSDAQVRELLHKMNAIRLHYFPTNKTVPGEVVRMGTTVLIKVVNTIYIAPKNPGTTGRALTLSHFHSGTTNLSAVLSCLVKLKVCTTKEAADYKQFRADNQHYELVRNRIADVEDTLRELKVEIPPDLQSQLLKLEAEADKILDLND